ncbi:type II and III secretion system protein family protein [Fimbriiglobus ruber]|uniref:Type IV pilus biogenesis protein PilQ n=1 Tax=Fimbriiglobus ruber TaxID=1908690 RepID=A0A225DJQ8_9BACT|nr:hypothetical protein [Fimbriiglobus ruber]OWK41642.1 Type IV pilus biogenesis protein PilQ [Fimbriiglobus ruber]
MHLTSLVRRRLLAGLTAAAGLTGGAAYAQPPAPPTPEVRFEKNTGAMIVPLGGAVRFDPKSDKKITESFIRNEDVLQERPDPTNPKVRILSGRQAGATVLTLTFDDRTQLKYDVVVQPDYALLENVIRQTVPTASVKVIPGVGNVIILSGYVTKPEDSDTVIRIASSAVGGTANNVINALQIGGSQHVLIDVTVAQIDRTLLRQRGFSFAVNGSSFGVSSIINGLASNTSGLPSSFTPATAGPNIVASIVPAGTIGALQALKTEGVAKFLSEPKVITQTGRAAHLLSGGQQAILSPSSGINGPGVTLQPIGTTLDVLPIVFGNGKIYLEVNPSFTSVNNGNGITTSFGFTPGFNTQETRSSVMLESGQTFAIGGLLETQTQTTVQKVPYLGDVPYFGTLFSSVSSDQRETELLILVTPRLVEPMDCGQVPKRVPTRETRNPDDYELFLESLIEAPRGPRKPWTPGGGYNAAYKCDPTFANYPCPGGACAGGAAGAAGCASGTCQTPGSLFGPILGSSVRASTSPAALAVTPAPAPVVSQSAAKFRPAAATTQAAAPVVPVPPAAEAVQPAAATDPTAPVPPSVFPADVVPISK